MVFPFLTIDFKTVFPHGLDSSDRIEKHRSWVQDLPIQSPVYVGLPKIDHAYP